jgi:hypothetical protein
VVIPNEVVSRYHVELRRHGQAWEVVGLGSNGTLLDGERITQAPLQDGQVIGLAPTGPTLRFQAGAGVPAAEKTMFVGALPGLSFEVDQTKKQRQLTEIVDSDYFRQLQQRAAGLRGRKADSAG